MNSISIKKTQAYFQVPLCALAYGSSVEERIDGIIAYSLFHTGMKKWALLSEAKQQLWQGSLPGFVKLTQGFNRNDTNHLNLIYGANLMEINIPDIIKVSGARQSFAEFHAKFEVKHGPDAKVRLRKDLLLEVRDQNGMNYVELSVLAGIYSVIGEKRTPRRITADQISVRSLGYKSKKVFEAELGERQDGLKPLSEWQLRSAVNRLYERKFFQRYTYGRRHTFYGVGMKTADFRSAVIEIKTRSFAARRLRQEQDRELTNIIRNQRAALSDMALPAPNAMPIPVNGLPNPEELVP